MWTEADIPGLSGKSVIVTGANSGIGYETARALAEKGAHVVMACRSLEKGNIAAYTIRKVHPEVDIVVVELDLSDLSSVRSFAMAIKGERSTLDVLCNNAGVMMIPDRRETADGFEMQFGTNHLGHFALTGLLFDLLRDTPGARVVTVSSVAHRMGKIDFGNLNAETSYSPRGVYGVSKLANLLFTRELRWRADDAGVDIVATAAHPGWTGTNPQRHTPRLNCMNRFVSQGPPMGALPTLYAIIADEMTGGKYAGPRGLLEMRGYPKRIGSSAASHDREVARKLWDISEQLTGVRFSFE